MNNKFRTYVVMVMLVFSTSACEPVSLALLGAGVGMGL